jgi:signal transduction histidine kinase
MLHSSQMSSLENIYMKMAPTLEPATLAGLSHEAGRPDNQKQVGREVAHELNNIFTIIRGYAERMILKHGDNPALRPDLLLIAENVKRAESVVRHSTPPRPRPAAVAA